MVRNLRNTKGWSSLPAAERQRRLEQQRLDLGINNTGGSNMNRAVILAPKGTQNIQTNPRRRAGRVRARGRKQNIIPTIPINEQMGSSVKLTNRTSVLQYFASDSAKYAAAGWQVGIHFAGAVNMPSDTGNNIDKFDISAASLTPLGVPANAIVLGVLSMVDVGSANPDVANVACEFISALVTTVTGLLPPLLKLAAGAAMVLFNKNTEMTLHQWLHVIPQHYRFPLNDKMFNPLSLAFASQGQQGLGPKATFRQELGIVFAQPLSTAGDQAVIPIPSALAVNDDGTVSRNRLQADGSPGRYVRHGDQYYHWRHWADYGDAIVGLTDGAEKKFNDMLKKIGKMSVGEASV